MPPRVKTQSLFSQTPNLNAVVARSTVRERISDKLASLVASGILQVGDELPSERELAALFSVSRETVRGAVQTLAARGVVGIAQGAHTRVISRNIDTLKIGVTSPSAINSYDIESVHKARLLVETAIVAEAATHIDDETLKRLKQSLEIQKHVMHDPVHFLICDREFHLAIYRSAGNPLLADFVTDLYTFMLDRRRIAISEPGAIDNSYGDHVAIYEALCARDPGAVTKAFSLHIDRIYATTAPLLSGGSRKKKTA